ncbi:MAG: gliding motility protein GldL [Candidatus Symbiothrix sp.]|jgi:gliding motility-associated protein GldL|nr:gliding motility protein GldL [Candidatus Symbiothrix sp.]
MGFKRRYKNFVEKFLSGEEGKRFFLVFYNIGAAIVIIGALAKLTHWPWGLGNIFLTIGLLTEFFVFLISAFDRPAKEYQWDRVFPVLDTNDEDDRPAFGGGGNGVSGFIGSGSGSGSGEGGVAVAGGKGGKGGGTVIIGGGSGGGFSGGGSSHSHTHRSAAEAAENMTEAQVMQSFGIPSAVNISEEDSNALTASIKKMASAADQLSKMTEVTDVTQQYLEQLSTMSEDMRRFSTVTNSLTDVSDILLNSYKSITDNSDGINQSSRGYVHQMENLNRNIQGLNTIYEIQLKGVSSQIDAIERINAGLMRIKDLYEGSIVDSSVFRSETEKMAQQLHALNGVYNRLLNAMTMNMYGAGGVSSFNPNPGNFNQNPL